MDAGDVNSYPKVSIEVVNNTKINIFLVYVDLSYMNEEGQIMHSDWYGVPGLTVMETNDGLQVTGIEPGGRGYRSGFMFCTDCINDATKLHFTITYDTMAPAIPGDIDRDGDVDFDDFFLLADNFGKTAEVVE